MSLKRVLVLGDAGVGKTQFINKRIGKVFDQRYIPTLGQIKEYKTNDTIYYDYPGQEIYSEHTITEPIDQVIYLYDMTSRMSFRNIVEWNKYVTKHYGEVDSVLIGTKNDLTQYIKVGADNSLSNK
tara:strand:+ start:9595 stop:9972 length:378 start_codon:yes stop_codon:yes gene_type:complete